MKSVLSDPFDELFGSFSHDRTLRMYKIPESKALKNAKISKIISKMATTRRSKKANQISMEFPNCDESVSTPIISENKNACNQAPLESKSPNDKDSKPSYQNQQFFTDSNKMEGLFQRADWSTCGWFFLTPCSQLSQELNGSKIKLNGAYLFSRSDLSTPIMFYPTEKQVIISKFSSRLYKKESINPSIEPASDNPNKIQEERDEQNDSESPFDLPYNLSFVLGTYSGIMVYSTKSVSPLFKLEHTHYAGLSDIAWHPSGLNFCVSSLDGFITFCTIKESYFGSPMNSIELIGNPDILNLNLKRIDEFGKSKSNHLEGLKSRTNFCVSKKVTFIRKKKM